MSIAQGELIKEKDKLDYTVSIIRKQIAELGQQLYEREEKVQEFKQFIWDNKKDMDPQELRSLRSSSDAEVSIMMKKGKYFQKLYRIQNNPYFGSIIFEEENNSLEVYLGITYLDDDKDNHLIYDWRSPICSLFYDYEVGPCSYKAPEGVIKGNLIRKRQYKIKDGKLVHVFDNSINIDDELLQEVLATESTDKMKNIVNTIQQEQNRIIRNVEDDNLIVQGIAGSGKTSVALHRIAFLLYKLKDLKSDNVLIFSPNQIFTEYISNVLPELGEDNTMQTTFHKFLSTNILEYRNVESFISFIGRYYSQNEIDAKLVKYKQSDEIIKDIEDYIKEYIKSIKFISGFSIEEYHTYSKEELNEFLQERYSHMYLFDRINVMAEKMSEKHYAGSHKHVPSIRKKIYDSLNIKKDYKKVYGDFYRSCYCKIEVSDIKIKSFVNRLYINYEDALLFTYMKGLLEGFDYNNQIKEVVIDEAQDYTKLQYMIIAKIFKNAKFTILGDINQTINPYYKYKSLYELSEIFSGSSRYLELLKTYRSTEEIIEYTNKILGLDHISAIRRSLDKPVITKTSKDLKRDLLADLAAQKKEYNYVALITKDDSDAEFIYNMLKDNVSISLVNDKTEKFNKDMIVTPAYMAKGLEFDSVIIYNNPKKTYLDNEKYLYYVACTRAQHQLTIYNNFK